MRWVVSARVLMFLIIFIWIYSIWLNQFQTSLISYSVANVNRASTEGAATIHAVRISKTNLHVAGARIITIIFSLMSNRVDHKNSHIAYNERAYVMPRLLSCARVYCTWWFWMIACISGIWWELREGMTSQYIYVYILYCNFS